MKFIESHSITVVLYVKMAKVDYPLNLLFSIKKCYDIIPCDKCQSFFGEAFFASAVA
jgi:hypothetical protein